MAVGWSRLVDIPRVYNFEFGGCRVSVPLFKQKRLSVGFLLLKVNENMRAVFILLFSQTFVFLIIVASYM